MSAAVFSDNGSILVAVDARTDTFDIVVGGAVGSDVSGWQPDNASWKQGSDQVVNLDTPPGTPSPGGKVQAALAVKNASPRLSARIFLEVADATPMTPEPPCVSAFPHLTLTITQADGGILMNQVSTPVVRRYRVAPDLSPGQWTRLLVTMDLDDRADPRSVVAVRFGFTADQP